MKINVSIVEDNREIRENLTQLLGQQPQLKCLSAFASGEAALAGFQEKCPEVVLMDISLPGMSGIKCTARLKESHPKIRVLMLTGAFDNDVIIETLKVGAQGYLVKNISVTELIQAILEVSHGGMPMTGQVARRVIEVFQQPSFNFNKDSELTAHESEILQLLGKGYIKREIISHLGISTDLARHHISQIYQKICTRHRSETVVKYLLDSKSNDPEN